MKNIFKSTALILTSILALASCSSTSNSSSGSSSSDNIVHVSDASASITLTSSATESINLTPDNVTISETYHTIESKRHYNTQVLPSIGDIKLLVIPVIISGYEGISLDDDNVNDIDKVKEDINETFFGKDGDEKLGYESVSSFYEKSSYGKLRLSGTVTDWFDLSETDLGYTSASSITISETYKVAAAAVNWAEKSQGIDMTQYDNDKDGYIDGVWLVYSAPNYSNGGPRNDDNNFWAYTTWGNQTTAGNVEDPIYNLFGWASYDFMYEGYGKKSLDAHTYIHETGHFLGLSDYYSDASAYNPIGKVDMMDANIVDHNSYSKMLLGWTKPYIVRGNKTIELGAMANENSFIVIPSDDMTITNGEFDPFGEYILIELYTNEGLNYKDSRVALSDRPLAMNSKGIRIYHIDSRKYLADVSDTSNITCTEYKGETLSKTKRIILPISNNRGSDTYNNIFKFDTTFNLFDEIRLFESNGKNTFSNGGYQKSTSLFDKGDSFSLATYGKDFFLNQTTFDNGSAFTSTITIGDIK